MTARCEARQAADIGDLAERTRISDGMSLRTACLTVGTLGASGGASGDTLVSSALPRAGVWVRRQPHQNDAAELRLSLRFVKNARRNLTAGESAVGSRRAMRRHAM